MKPSKEYFSINQIKDFVKTKNLSSIMNNKKWHSLFDNLEHQNFPIILKSLLSEDKIKSDFIREIYQSTILLKDNGIFNWYAEIEYLEIQKSTKAEIYLNEKNLNFIITENKISIFGYQ